MAAAFEHFDRAVADHPEDPDARYYRGLTHMNLGRNSEAVVDFEKLIELAPEHDKAAEVGDFLTYLKPASDS